MSPPYFSNDFNIYIRYLPVVKNISKIGYCDENNEARLNRKPPFSDLIDYKITSNWIHELKKIDCRMSQRKKITFDLIESNISLRTYDTKSMLTPDVKQSIISITNISEANLKPQSALNSSIDSLSKMGSRNSLQSSLSNQNDKNDITVKTMSQYDLFKKISIKILEPEKTDKLNQNNNSNLLAAKKWQKIVKTLKSDKKHKKDDAKISCNRLQTTKRNNQYLRTCDLYKFDLNSMKNGFNVKSEKEISNEQKKIRIKQIFVKSLMKAKKQVIFFFFFMNR